MTRFRNPRAASAFLSLAGVAFLIVAYLDRGESTAARLWGPIVTALLLLVGAGLQYHRSRHEAAGRRSAG